MKNLSDCQMIHHQVFDSKNLGLDGLISFALTIVSQAERTVCHVITWRLIFVLKPTNVGHKEKKM